MTASKIKQSSQMILPTTLIAIIILIIINPEISMNGFYTGITIWATKVMPSLLPFFILTKILTNTILIEKISNKLSKITRILYGVGGLAGYVYLIGIISGYPVGTKLTSELYEDGKITYRQATTITSFTSTSGPLFILGTIGVGIYHSMHLGIIIFIAHTIGAMVNGLIYRNKDKYIVYDNFYNINDNNINISDTMYNSIHSILIIGGFIALAYMIIHLIEFYNGLILLDIILRPLGINGNIIHAIVSGIIEITTGSIMLANCNLSIVTLTILLTFLVSFGGLSIHAQTYIFLSKFNMPYSKFLLQKITHAIISSVLACVIILIV